VIDPELLAVPGEASHFVACLLEPRARRTLWEQLRAGRMPNEALVAAGLPEPAS
jgi:hypothetical protein